MLYFIHGTDKEKARGKARELVAALRVKKPEAEYFRITAEDFELGRLRELAAGRGLFASRYIVLLDSICGNKETKEEVLGALPAVKESENIFIALESALDAPTKKKIEDLADKTQEFGSVAAAKPEQNFFALADAFGARDRERLWVLYEKAVWGGASPEELSGIIFWQIKSVILAQTESNTSAGLSPFVYQKSKRYGQNFSLSETFSLARNLITLYHNSHRGLVDFETGLEHFILQV